MISSAIFRARMPAALAAAILVAPATGCSGLPRRPSLKPTPEPIIRRSPTGCCWISGTAAVRLGRGDMMAG